MAHSIPSNNSTLENPREDEESTHLLTDTALHCTTCGRKHCDKCSAVDLSVGILHCAACGGMLDSGCADCQPQLHAKMKEMDDANNERCRMWSFWGLWVGVVAISCFFLLTMVASYESHLSYTTDLTTVLHVGMNIISTVILCCIAIGSSCFLFVGGKIIYRTKLKQKHFSLPNEQSYEPTYSFSRGPGL
jgi:hypothetical protein